ncbi:hypothetical protein SUGI_0251130 [Cryptomeria japonica]|nr:hypothetical protein SUGI_0251130 [Cryptomeria japonica]
MNAVITAYRGHGYLHKPVTLFYQMQLTGIQTNHFTFASTLTESAKKDVLKALSQIIDPDFGTDIVSCGFVKDIELDEISGEVSFRLKLTTPACPIKDMFEQQANDVVAALPCVQKLQGRCR